MSIQLPGGYHLTHDRFGGVWLLRGDNTPARLFSYREPETDRERAFFAAELYSTVMADSVFRALRGES